jgi:hypothetical protein
MPVTYTRRKIEDIEDALQRFIATVTNTRKPGMHALMTIPPDEAHDADLILKDAINELKDLRQVEIRYSESLYESKSGRC